MKCKGCVQLRWLIAIFLSLGIATTLGAHWSGAPILIAALLASGFWAFLSMAIYDLIVLLTHRG